METRKIGSLDVSVVGLGCNNFGWRLDEDATRKVVLAALDAGITFFDTADVYGGTRSEEYLGRALGKHRNEVFIATKFGSELDDNRKGASAGYISRAIEDSLRRLGTDWVDLYQLHWPDPSVRLEETLGALNKLVENGKVRVIGCSNFSAVQLREAAQISSQKGLARFVSVQNEYSLLHREPELEVIPECIRANIAFIPYFPLASGLLTGKYRKNKPAPKGSRLQNTSRFGNLLTEQNLNRVESLIRFASSHNHTLLELAFSWLAAQPSVVSVIAGATSPEQVHANARAVDWKLTDSELEEINRIVPLD